MDNYYLKYLKYKTKYINLLEQLGGTNKVNRNKFTHNCFIYGYKQHSGECWNDSIQTIVTFSYPFVKTQELALIKQNEIQSSGITIISNAIKYRDHLKPIYFTYSDNPNDENTKKFNELFAGYLNRLISRFTHVYDNHINTSKKKEQTMSITCAVNALEFTQINRKITKKIDRHIHDAQLNHEILTLHCLSFVLLNGNSFVNFDIYDDKTINNIVYSDKNYFAIQLGTYDHSFSVYSCPGHKHYFYDDNNSQSFEFDWINWFKKNIKYKSYIDGFKDEYNLLNTDINLWEPYLVYEKAKDPRHITESILSYYNSKDDEIIILVGNEYKLFKHTKHNSTISSNPTIFISRVLYKINSMIGLYIDSASTQEEYISKLNLYNLLYTHNYDLDFVKEYIVNHFTFVNLDPYTFKNLMIDALILSHDEIINKAYENEGKQLLKIIDDKTNQPYYFDLIKYFSNIKDYSTFIFKYNEDEFINEFIIDVICYNETIGLKALKKPSFYNYLNTNFLYVIEKLIVTNNAHILFYIIKNNMCNCWTTKYNISDNDEQNNVSLIFYLGYYYNPAINTEITFANLIEYMANEWNPEYAQLFNSVDKNNHTLLYYIFMYQNKTAFNKILTVLINLHKKQQINIFTPLKI